MSDPIVESLKDDFSLLIEAGFVAVKQLDEVSANRIFHAAHLISPNSTAPAIGLGYISLNKLELKAASKIFESIVSQEPENYLAITFLGMSYLLQKGKREEGEKLIQKSMANTTDATIKNLGELALEWSEKDLKKNESPFFDKKSS